MKNKLIPALLTTLSLCLLSACGTEEVTEESVTPASELVTLMNTDIPSVEEDEKSAMSAYNSYFSENTDLDKDALLADLDDNIIPTYETFMTNLEAIAPETEEVKAVYDLYYDSMNLQYQAIVKIEQALTEESEDYQTEAAELLTQSKDKYQEFQQAVSDLAEENNIVINGTTETTEATDTIEATDTTEATESSQE